jgi:ring-1,2-phenylacetyl-CoA epoxidase subunit PaaC
MSTVLTEDRVERADQLSADARSALRDLILALADSKRVLGLRYSDRMLGAPTLEAGIAASSMAQDEWGHGRLTYALLSDFGDDPKGDLEHARPAAEYRSAGALDRDFGSWSEMIAAGLLLDVAFTTQYGALVDSRYTPVHNRVQKMLDEEKIHFQYFSAWTRRMASIVEVRAELAAALRAFLPVALQWLGRDDAATARLLVSEGLVRQGPDALRARLLQRVGPVLEAAGMADEVEVALRDGVWSYTGALQWDGWDDARRRGAGSLDEVTAARARGDKNRALLMD